MRKDLLQIVVETIDRHRMLAKGEKVLVALSAGPDSICLLDVLLELRPRYSHTVCAAHFNHRLRGREAEEDARFAEEIANRRGIAFASGAADAGEFAKEQKLSIETAGRTLRYDFLSRACASLGASKIAVGHTADDQAETIIMRLIRGSGSDGLAGIPPARFLAGEKGPRIIRPLINAWKKDVIAYLRTRKLKFRKDASNESVDFLRNKIRLELLPHLEREYNPQVKERLVTTAAALATERDFVDAEARLLTAEMIVEEKAHWILFHADLLAAMHPALRKRIISRLILRAKPNAPMLEARHHAKADSLVRAGAGRLEMPGKLRMEVSGGFGLITAAGTRSGIRKTAVAVALDAQTPVPQFDIVVKTKVLKKIASPSSLIRRCSATRQYFELDAVRLPLEVRSRRAGDTFRPLGMRGEKKLKDLFIDKKIPRFLRDGIPLLLSNGAIMWVMGHVIDRRFMLKANSRAALRVDYEKRTPFHTP